MNRLFASLVGTALLVGAMAAPVAAQSLTPAQTEDVAKIVRDTILKNPEILLEAMRLLEERQKLDADAATKHVIAQSGKELREDPDSVVTGNPKGDITVVEFFDYRCGYCKRAHATMADLRKSDSKVRIVLKEFPILGPDSVVASRAAIAARKSDKYLKFHDALMTARGNLDEETVLQIAAEVGLDRKKIKADMAGKDVDAVIQRTRALAERLGVNGTPAFVIGDTLIPGAADLATLKTVVAAARSACKTSVC